jgi:hypothetical protein
MHCKAINARAPHIFSHARGRTLANKDHDSRSLQDWLDHRHIQHTVRYPQLSATRFKDFWGSDCHLISGRRRPAARLDLRRTEQRLSGTSAGESLGRDSRFSKVVPSPCHARHRGK